MEVESLRRAITKLIEETDTDGLPSINFLRRAGKGIEGEGQKLVVFPSSFNPLTEAHIEIIEEAREYKLDELLLLLDKSNIDKEVFAASLEDRLLMLLPYFESDEGISIALSSHGLFLDKVRALVKIYPATTEIVFLVGYDTMVRILDKRYYRDREAALDELFGSSRFLVAGRGDKGEEAIFELFHKEENRRFRHKVRVVKLKPFASSISSTQVREMVRQGKSITGLVPHEVLSFIQEMELYKENR
jgi:nicotinamide-nucleotide adenylyltransferase